MEGTLKGMKYAYMRPITDTVPMRLWHGGPIVEIPIQDSKLALIDRDGVWVLQQGVDIFRNPGGKILRMDARGLNQEVFVVVQVTRRVGNFGLARPTRELLFNVVPREDKYKAKSVIDTAVYRAGDQIGSWSYALLGMAGLGSAGVALVALPIAAGWIANALWLGRRQRLLARPSVPR